MANFIALVYATLKNEGIDTSGMEKDEAVAKFKELQKSSGGKEGEKEGTPAENRKLEESGIKSNDDYKDFADKKLPSGKDYDSIEIGNVTFEKYSKASLLNIIKDYKSGVSQMNQDETIFIEYKDGSTKYIESGEDIDKLTNIKSIIWSHENGYGFTGDVQIVNYNEIFNDWGGNDYRVELKSDIPSLIKQSKKDEPNTDNKQKQLDIINKYNPMRDDYHTGIRSVDDIKTFDEVIDDDESFVWGDFEREDAKKALETGEITIYSSKPIGQGVFVSTSKNQARDYAGGGQIYSKTVPLKNVAWINGDEGQYAEV